MSSGVRWIVLVLALCGMPLTASCQSKAGKAEVSCVAADAPVSLSGRLILRPYFGPPNYGETPQTDEKLTAVILVADTPLRICGLDAPQAEFHLAGDLAHLASGQAVTISGELFSAQTAYHQTPALIFIKEVTPVRPATLLSRLPSVSDMIRVSKGLALLDAALSPDWERRYFSFDAHWANDGSQMMASMRNGAGDEYYFLFDSAGVAGKILLRHSEASPPRLAAVPAAFRNFTTEPAFTPEEASYYVWRGVDDTAWHSEPAALARYELLGFVIGEATVYHAWAEAHYNRDIDIEVVRQVLATARITSEQIKRLNPGRDVRTMTAEVLEITGERI